VPYARERLQAMASAAKPVGGEKADERAGEKPGEKPGEKKGK
jgi:hypothetical protein